MAFPEVQQWTEVRNRIRERAPLLKDPKTHDAAHAANWADCNTIFSRPIAMAVCYLPNIYSVWPAYWHDHVMRQYLTGKHCAIAGPRRRGKSKVAQAYQMYQMLTLEWTYSLHICLSPELVLQHSQHIIQELETNTLLQKTFEIMPGRIQRGEHFEVKVGRRHPTRLIFEWMTRDGRPRGTGPHGIIIDDIDDTDDTAYVMEKYYNKVHSAIMGALEGFKDGHAQMLVCGNYTGRQCSMRKFQEIDAVEHPEDWIVLTIPAIEEGETQHITKVPVGESVWPDKHSTEETLKKIAQMNVTRLKSGDMELQNKFADAADLIWFKEMFEDRFTELPPKQQRVSRVYIDSSQKVREAGDEWAIGRMTKVIDGPDKGAILLEKVRMAPFQPTDAADVVIELFIGNGTSDMPQCEIVKMESKTDKGQDPFLALVQQRARMRNVFIPTEELVPAGKDKRTRSQEAAPVGRSGAIRTPVHWDADMRRCIGQLCDFTGKTETNMHAVDDGHDMFVWGVNDLKNVEAPEAQESKPIALKNKLGAIRTKVA